MPDVSPSRLKLRQEAMAAARGLAQGDDALVAVLRDLERERGRATQSVRSVVQALAATLQARDGYTGEHADAVHDLSVAVGDRLGLRGQEMAELAAVALLHDVGKIGIPDSLLHKQGPLDPADWVVMREHPVIGERILATVPGLESVARAVRHEHERWDGDGYPDGLVGDAIPLASRIVLACDAWHALGSDRPYRKALPRDVALAELRRCAGTQFDPTVAAALIDVLESTESGDDANGRPDPGAIVADVVGGNASLERELVALIAVASAVAAAHKLEEVIEIAAEEALGAIGAASLSIERWIADRGILRTLVNVGDLAPGEERHPVDELYQLEGDRDLRRVLEDGGTYFCSLDDPEIADVEAEMLRALGKNSSVAVPITFGGETWGQIWATRRADQQPFSERDARFLHAISGQVGSAIGRAEVFSRVSELAHSDGLTGLANRRAFDEALELAVLEARRTGHDLALLLCDMDNLKDINDHHGHEAGDAALRTVAGALSKSAAVVKDALVCRVGGDEFAIVLHRSDTDRGRDIAESILRRLRSSHPPVGVSCGVAMLRAGEGRPADLLRAADAAQYAAKRGGRGRVYVAGPGGAIEAATLAGGTPGRSRAIRDAPQLDLGRLIKEVLGVLDRPLAGAPPAERLGGVLRRIGEATDAAGWTVAFAPIGREPEPLVVGGRPGNVGSMVRSGAWLDGRDLLALRMASAGSGSGCLVVERSDAQLTGLLRECMMRTSLDTLLVHTVSGSSGAWIAEVGGDARTRDLRQVEPVLRLLVPEALRGLRDARHAGGGYSVPGTQAVS
ncbi:MAG TPA: diguanylate cyclase [Solirubrobacteraceae bacterium]|nr:diguanylate cyclase [Solirubrobacteraceae bacterium]